MNKNELLEGIDFSVKMEKVMTTVNGKQVVVPNRFATINAESGQIFGIVGSEYKPQDHRENLVKVAKALKSFGDFTVRHSVEGARIWSSFKMEGLDILKDVKDERAKVMVNVLNSYDGSTSVRISVGVFRMICSNGMYGFANQYSLNKIHSKHLEIDNVQEIKAVLDDYSKAYVKFYNVLVKQKPVEIPVLKEALPEKLVIEASKVGGFDINAWL